MVTSYYNNHSPLLELSVELSLQLDRELACNQELLKPCTVKIEKNIVIETEHLRKLKLKYDNEKYVF